MIFDIHTHILPAVDDGARNSGSTTRMLKVAAESGTTCIVATPHFVNGTTKEKTIEIIEKYQQVREQWRELSPKNELYLGNELFYGEELVEALNQEIALTMNGTNYILVEFPVYSDFAYIRRAVQTLTYAGYWPILAHIERYEGLKKKANVEELIRMGAYMQVNADTILGKNGFFVKGYVMDLLKASLIHFVASDAHGSRERRPELNECIAYLEKKIGKIKTRQLFRKNPIKMLKGEKIDE